MTLKPETEFPISHSESLGRLNVTSLLPKNVIRSTSGGFGFTAEKYFGDLIQYRFCSLGCQRWEEEKILRLEWRLVVNGVRLRVMRDVMQMSSLSDYKCCWGKLREKNIYILLQILVSFPLNMSEMQNILTFNLLRMHLQGKKNYIKLSLLKLPYLCIAGKPNVIHLWKLYWENRQLIYIPLQFSCSVLVLGTYIWHNVMQYPFPIGKNM